MCAKYPFRPQQSIIAQLAEQEMGGDLDQGVYEFLYRTNKEETLAADQKLPHGPALKTAERCTRHTRRLQSDLIRSGLLNREGQKCNEATGESRIIAPLSFQELNLGRILGTGGFSSVFEVMSYTLDPAQKFNPQEQNARKAMKDTALAVPTVVRTEKEEKGKAEKGKQEPSSTKTLKGVPEPQYAIKHLRRGLIKEPDKFERAAIDMVLEAQLLLAMDHPNIVSLRGWAGEGVQGYSTGRHTAFFIVIDRLVESLDDRLALWRNAHRKYKGRTKMLWGKSKYSSKLDHLLDDRLMVTQGITSAIEYMHERRIIYRDLKSSNIGFDMHGTLKLFDFGLSRLLPSRKSAMHDGYTMSRVGTKYYMAPEVRAKAPYNLSADMYSFGVVFWEIMSLSSPRETLQKAKKDEVTPSRRCQLPICECWPAYVQSVIELCLSNDPHHRPKIGEVRLGLLKQVELSCPKGSRSSLGLDSSTVDMSSVSNYSQLSDFRTSMGMTDSDADTVMSNTIGNFG